MYRLTVENRSGLTLELTNRESDFQVIRVTGLNPPPAVINTAAIAGQDGAQFNSSRLNTRNIVITLRINGDVETNRLLLYRAFVAKDWVKISYHNESRDVYAEGYVESVECDYFTNSETVQASVICPNAYWQNAAATTVALSPYGTSVTNNSEDETGFTIEASFADAATSFSVQVQQGIAVNLMMLSYAFESGDELEVSTIKGNKRITLTRDGATTNILSALAAGSSFVQLAPGANMVRYSTDADPDDVSVTLTFREQYRGV